MTDDTPTRPELFAANTGRSLPLSTEAFEAELQGSATRDPFRFALGGLVWTLATILAVVSPALVIALYRVLL